MATKPFEGISTLETPVRALVTGRRAVLTMLRGGELGRVLSVSLGVSVTLGRRRKCTHMIDDASVSGVHARVVVTGEDYVIADEGSTNGTYVNGERLTGPVKLADGDRVQLGPIVLFRFSRVDEAEEAALKGMYDAALRDGLTGLFNRKHLDDRLEAEIAFAKRHPPLPLSIVLFDVDHFKKVNDTHGHLAGDTVLKALAATLARMVRTEDIVARYGGEEFVVVARSIRADEAVTLAERLRVAIGELSVPCDGKELKLTVSAGVASLDCCGEARNTASLFGLADGRLYAAKEGGRNRVVGP